MRIGVLGLVLIGLAACGEMRPLSPYQAMAIMQMNNANFQAQQERQVEIFRASLARQPMRLRTTCTTLGAFTTCD